MSEQNKVWRILCIDDDEEDFFITRHIFQQLEEQTVHLDWASSYAAGQAALAQGLADRAATYEAVLVDYDLGGQAGRQTGIEIIRAYSGVYPAPLILYTGQDNPERDREAQQAGASMYLTKGEVNPRLLERTIRYAMARKRAEQALRQSPAVDEPKQASREGAAHPPYEQAFRESQQRLHDVLDTISDGFFSLDQQWRVTQVNQQAAYQAGLAVDELPGKTIWEALPALAGSALEPVYRRVMQERRVEEVEIYNPSVRRWFQLRVYPSTDGISVYSFDITQRKQTEEALRASRERTKHILESITDGFFELDRDWRFTYINHRAAHNVGHEPGELIGKNLWEMFPGIIGTEQERICRAVMHQRQAIHVEVHGTLTDQWYDYHVYPSTAGITVYWADISGRKQAEGALAESEHRLRIAKEAAQIGIFDYDIPLGLINWDPRVRQLWGVGPDEPITYVTFMQGIHPDDRAMVQEAVDQAFNPHGDGKYSIEYRVIHRGDQSEHWVASKGEAFFENGEAVHFIGTVEDISERKWAEETLRESEEKFHSVFENAAIGFAMHTPQGSFVDANAAYCRITGYTLQELHSLPANRVIYAQDWEENERLARQVLAGQTGAVAIESRYVRKDGRIVWVRKSASLVHNRQGVAKWIIVLIEDITDRKQAEESLAVYADELERSNKALQEFAYIASHDLQEPLRKVQMFGDLLDTSYAGQLGEEGKDYLARMISAAARMREMIDGLLTYARVTSQGTPFSEVDLQVVAQEVLSDLEVRIKETAGQVELGELPVVQADALQMRQLLQNLIGNALKYHRPDVPPQVRIFSQTAEDRRVYLMVADNCIGFDMAEAQRIFQPFVRLHGRSTYKGTGMGLAICQKIAERHGGSISVESVPGAGSTFKVELPRG